ncbi:tyrosine-type recombinase/integrase [Janthinobacterium sp. HLX7-2]|uniref:tyrosine-type recombinase/integrase n=1 Tax=Janthinobacterium sp. HLX7-2 TaxID=1259331 RepID=UPI003F23D527
MLQVSGAAARSWLFRYCIGGKRREMGLGSCLAVDLAEARVRARQCRLLLSEGRDPLAMRRQEEPAGMLARARQMSFAQCAAAYIAAHRHGWRNAKHVAQWESTLAAYVFPVMGTLPVAAIDTDLVVKVLGAIWLSKTETATRIRGRIECILDWATVSGFRQGENPARWKGHLENLLANPNKVAPVKNRPALPWQEIGRFMAALSAQEGIAARALSFAILTAALR